MAQYNLWRLEVDKRVTNQSGTILNICITIVHLVDAASLSICISCSHGSLRELDKCLWLQSNNWDKARWEIKLFICNIHFPSKILPQFPLDFLLISRLAELSNKIAHLLSPWHLGKDWVYRRHLYKNSGRMEKVSHFLSPGEGSICFGDCGRRTWVKISWRYSFIWVTSWDFFRQQKDISNVDASMSFNLVSRWCVEFQLVDMLIATENRVIF